MTHQLEGETASTSQVAVHVLDLQEIVSKNPETWTPEEFDFLLWATPRDEREQVRVQYEKLMYRKAQAALEELRTATAPESTPTFDDYFDDPQDVEDLQGARSSASRQAVVEDAQDMRSPAPRKPAGASDIVCALVGFLCAGMAAWMLFLCAAGQMVAPWVACVVIYVGLCAPWGIRSLARNAGTWAAARRKGASGVAVWLMQWLLRAVMCGFVGVLALPVDLVRHFRSACRTGRRGPAIVVWILVAVSFMLPLSFLYAGAAPRVTGKRINTQAHLQNQYSVSALSGTEDM